MAFGYDTKSQSSLASTDPVTVAYTPGAGTKLLALAVLGEDNTARTGGNPSFPGVTYDGDYNDYGPLVGEYDPYGHAFSSDGTKVYICGTSLDAVYQCTLSPAWDLSTASDSGKSCDVSSQTTTPYSVRFSSDGETMYVAGYVEGEVFQYTLTNAWDVSTASYANKSATVTSYLCGICFKSDGTKMYVLCGGGIWKGYVYEYNLSTAWDVSSAGSGTKTFNVNSEANGAVSNGGLAFSSDGNIVIVGVIDQSLYGTIWEYELSIAWDSSTASYSGRKYALTNTSGKKASDVFYKPDGTKFFTLDSVVSDGSYAHSLSLDWHLGNSFTQVDSSILGSKEGSAELWYLADPIIDTGNIVVPNSGTLELRIQAVSFTSSADPSLFDNTSKNTDSPTPSLTINSVPDGSVVLSCLAHGDKDVPSARSNTVIYENDEGSYSTNAQYELKSGAGNTTHNWTMGKSDDVAMIMAAWEETTATTDINVNDTNPNVTDYAFLLLNLYLISLYESITTIDEAIVHLTPFLFSEYDQADVSDYADVQITPYLVSVDDNIGLTDDSTIERVEPEFLDISAFDSITVTDETASEIDIYLINVSNQLTIQDASSQYLNIYQILVSEDIGLQDASQQYLNIYLIAVNDGINLQDASNQYLTVYEISVFDDIGLQDESSQYLDLYQISVNDDLEVTEDISLYLTLYEVSVADDLEVIESTFQYLDKYLISVDDSLTVADYSDVSLIAAETLEVNVAEENPDVTDESLQYITPYLINVADDIALEDSTSQYLNKYLVNVDDDLTIEDYSDQYLTIFEVNKADELSLDDDSQQYLTLYEVLSSDDIGIEETVNLELDVYFISVSEDLTVTDYSDQFVTAADVVYINEYDDVGLQDSATTELNLYFVNVNDDIGLQDSSDQYLNIYEINISNDIGLQDSPDVQLTPYLVNVFDGVVVEDESSSYLTVYLINQADELIISDYIENELTLYEIGVFDDIGLQENTFLELSYYEVNVADNITVQDYTDTFVTAAGELYVNVYEDLILQDSSDTQISPYLVSASDDLSVTDSSDSYLTIYVISQFDSINAQDDTTINIIGVGIHSINVNDNIVITEATQQYLNLYEIDENDDLTIQDESINAFDLYLISEADELTVTDDTNSLISPYLINEYEPIAVTEYNDQIITLKTRQAYVNDLAGLEDYANVAIAIYPFLQAFLTVQTTKSIIDISQTMSELDVKDKPSIVSVTM